MNDTIEISNASAPPALRKALENSYVFRDKARAKVEEAVAACARGENPSTAAIDKVAEIKKRLATLEASEAKRIAAAIAVGRPTAALPDNAAGDLPAELAAAEYHASVMARAMGSLRAARDQAQAVLAVAEAAVIKSVDAILDEEQLNVARQIQRLLDEAVTLGRPLFLEALADEMHTRRRTPAEVTAVLVRIDPLIDRMHIAGNVLRKGNSEAIAARAARRAEMILGESAPVETAGLRTIL
jgi:hypothetical protein